MSCLIGGDGISATSIDKLYAFVNVERSRFDDMQSNTFALSMAHVGRYWSFLALIADRYEAVSTAVIADSEAFVAAAEAGREYPDELVEKARQLTDALHLEIESFYLFAKILLDHIAHAIFYYFGPARGIRQFRHSVLVKKLKAYAAVKNLVIPDGFLAQARALQTRVSNYRDHNVTHDNSPRTIYVTMWDSVEKTTRLAPSRLQPVEYGDEDRRSSSPGELLAIIGEYIEGLVCLLEANRSKTGLTVIVCEDAAASESERPGLQSSQG